MKEDASKEEAASADVAVQAFGLASTNPPAQGHDLVNSRRAAPPMLHRSEALRWGQGRKHQHGPCRIAALRAGIL
jgi:hypothetical protein